MNSIEAAIVVLRKAGTPLRFEELTERMVPDGLWSTKGKTPAATVNAAITVNIKKKGESSTFVRVASGTYGLRELGDDGGHRGTVQCLHLLSSDSGDSTLTVTVTRLESRCLYVGMSATAFRY